MTPGQPLKCFLSYSGSQAPEVAAMVALLKQLDVDTFTAQDIVPGQAIALTIVSALRAADFVCVILSDASVSANVAFETGLAIGLGKPVLTLSRGSDVPFDIGKGIQVLRLKSSDLSSVLPDIRRFVRHIKVRPQSSQSVLSSNPQSAEMAAAALKDARRSTSSRDRAHALIDVVAHLFHRPDLEVLREEASSRDNRPDLLIWSDPLVAELGGPLIIECKYYSGSSGSVLVNARHALQQLQSYVEHSSAGLGLLVFDYDRPKDLKLSPYELPKALAFYVEDLVEAVAAERLNDELWRRRAQASQLKELRGDAG